MCNVLIQGYEDTMRFLTAGNLILCANCQKTPAALPPTDCRMCKATLEEAANKTLPLEIKEVFNEAAKNKAMKAAVPGLMNDLFFYVTSPFILVKEAILFLISVYLLSRHIMLKSYT